MTTPIPTIRFAVVGLTVYLATLAIAVLLFPGVVFDAAGRLRDYGTREDHGRSPLTLHVVAPLSAMLGAAAGAAGVLAAEDV